MENYPCGGLIRHLRAFGDETEDFCFCSLGMIKEIKASIFFLFLCAKGDIGIDYYT